MALANAPADVATPAPAGTKASAEVIAGTPATLELAAPVTLMFRFWFGCIEPTVVAVAAPAMAGDTGADGAPALLEILTPPIVSAIVGDGLPADAVVLAPAIVSAIL
jgi:hypothetical protein